MPHHVTTSFGALQGAPADGGVTAYLGVPYAAAPIGSRRFQLPQPPQRWDGVRPAQQNGFSPLQGGPTPGRVVADLSCPAQDEDCLNLNIWTPAPDPQARLPVLVWIYGGAFVTGSNSVPAYNGARLAARGVVVVGLNYRLGVLGWLRCPSIGASGNQGLADQRAALAWVQQEIAAFGGDPVNVTVFGESAGAASIAMHLAAGETSGFRRAILQSGSYNLAASVDEADDAAARVLDHLGVTPQDLVSLPPAALIEAQDVATPRSAGVFYRPVTDGDLVPEDPAAKLTQGVDVPVICGTNRHEMGFFWGRDERFDEVSDQFLTAMVGRWSNHPVEVIETYRRARRVSQEPTDIRSLAVAIGSDWTFRAASMALAGWQSTGAGSHAYRFDWESPLFDGLVGAAHVLEVPFVFSTYAHPTVASFTGTKLRPDQAAALSEEVAAAWVGFARSGDPGWPRYNLQARPTRVFGGSTTILNGPNRIELDLWDPRDLHR